MTIRKEPFDLGALHSSWPEAAAMYERPLVCNETSRYQAFYGLDFELQEESVAQGFFQSGGHRIALQSFKPVGPKGTVFIMHGLYDHLGLYRHIIDFLLGQGWAVVGFDLPGHGLSSGPRTSIGDFNEYVRVFNDCLDHVENMMPKPWRIISQSTGAAISMTALLDHPAHNDSFDKLVMLAPLIKPVNWWWHRAVYRACRPFLDSVARKFSENSGDPDFVHFVRELDPLQPRRIAASWVGALDQWIPAFNTLPCSTLTPLVVQGERDATVDWRKNIPAIASKFRDPKVLMLPGARHHLANESLELRQQYLGAIKLYFEQ